MFLALQFSLPSGFLQGGHSSLPQCWPLPRFLLKALARILPPASWYFTLKPVISAILSSSSFRLLSRVLPLVLGTNTTVAAACFNFPFHPAFWRIFFLFLILPSDFGVGRPSQGSSSFLPLNQLPLFRAFSLDLTSFLHPALGNKGWYPGWFMSRQLLFILASKDLMPCSTAILMNSSEWPLVLIFIQAFSKISSRLEGSSLGLVFLSLLATSSDRVAIFTSLLRAESASTIRLVAMVFSKNSYIMVLPFTTQMQMSRLGSFPSLKSSPNSIVKFRKGNTSFIIATSTRAVLLAAESPDFLSSSSQDFVKQRLPSIHLQPIFRDFKNALMSSIYLSLLPSLMLFCLQRSIHLASHSFMTTLATAHVLRSPIGPPAFCR